MAKWRQKLRVFFNRFSIQEISAHLLSIPRYGGDTPGLIVIQIDGLSRDQFQDALDSGKLPFIKQLMFHSNYRLHSLYSGLPSSTPVVQAELFYGVKCALPAFGYYSRRLGIIGTMLSPQFARSAQSSLEKRGYNLLKGGSAYSDIFTGGAEKAFFCPTSLGFDEVWRGKKIRNLIIIMFFHWFLFLRAFLLLILEFFIAIIDFFRGLLQHQCFIQEIIFVPSRVVICLLLRELVVAGVTIDAVRGYPIIHCNFLGYDEQAHRRGPRSAFAHWTLKGIDGAIRRIVNSAKRSAGRKYTFLIYSDHGQQEVKSYSDEFGISLNDKLTLILDQKINSDKKEADIGIQKRRAQLLGSRMFRNPESLKPQKQKNRIIISSIGPLAHIYFNENLNAESRRNLANLLVRKANVPAILFSDSRGEVCIANANGCFPLRERAAEFLGADHPFKQEVTSDLIELAGHPDSGDLICCGWRCSDKPLSFPRENGAHAGPGPQETHGFAITPPRITPEYSKKNYIRPLDLRKAIMKFIEK